MNNGFTQDMGSAIKKEFDATHWKGSFGKFLELVEKYPKANTRTSFQYLNDMIHYFGNYQITDCGDDLIRYSLFDDPFNAGENAIHGNHRALLRFVYSIKSIAEQGGRERILILKGPVATAKTSIIRMLIQGLEEYSKSPEGGFYKFSWIFPKENFDVKLGFEIPEGRKSGAESYAGIDPSELLKIPCQLNENPLMLLPKKQRRVFLEDIIKKIEFDINVHEKIKKNDLCFNCQNIYNFLLEKYNGDIEKVFNHVIVERFIISEIDRTGIATVQPVQNVEGRTELVAWESSKYAQVSQFLRGIVLNLFDGKWANSNRGIIHLTDMFKRKGAYLQHLLSAVQENLVDFNGADAFVDTVIIGTSNLTEYEMFNEDETNAGLKDRMFFSDVSYVMQYTEEVKIYEKQLKTAGYQKKAGNSKHVCPHVLDFLALWVVTTRMMKPNANYYSKNSDAEECIKDLSLVQKALLYNGILDNSFSFDQRQVLKDKKLQKKLRNEYPQEGMNGISPRQIQNMIGEIISKKEYTEETKGLEHECLNMFSVLRQIKKMYNNELDGCGEEHIETLDELTARYDEKVRQEVKLSIAGIDEQRVIEKIKEYVRHVKAYINKEGIKNHITGEFEPPSEDKMRWLENNLEEVPKSDAERREFRVEILQEIAGSTALENPILEDSDYKSMFLVLYESLEDIMFQERFKGMKMTKEEIKRAVDRYGTHKFAALDARHQNEIKRVITNLVNNYGYCPKCAKGIIKYSLEDRFIIK